jgi:hypothetical protein
MFTKLGSGRKEIISGSIPLLKGPAEALGNFPCKPTIFRNQVRKVIINSVK